MGSVKLLANCCNCGVEFSARIVYWVALRKFEAILMG